MSNFQFPLFFNFMNYGEKNALRGFPLKYISMWNTLFYSLLLKRCLWATVLASILSSDKKIKDGHVVWYQSVKP